MELSEATSLAGTFITSMIFKVHSLPASERAHWAVDWWQRQGSRIPLRPALEEHRRHLSLFATRRRMDNRRKRQVPLEMSAIVDDDRRGRCPALVGNLCGLYQDRPLTCRAVPLHYSRAPSTLRNYLDQFTRTPGHQCETGAAAPAILDGSRILDAEFTACREAAERMARRERPWKEYLLALMDDNEKAAAAGLPTYDAVLANSDQGYASVVPMIVAWRVARQAKLLTEEDFAELCRKQSNLLDQEMAHAPNLQRREDLRQMLAVYRVQAGAHSSSAFPQHVDIGSSAMRLSHKEDDRRTSHRIYSSKSSVL